jgi:hypothetical protein
MYKARLAGAQDMPESFRMVSDNVSRKIRKGYESKMNRRLARILCHVFRIICTMKCNYFKILFFSLIGAQK